MPKRRCQRRRGLAFVRQKSGVSAEPCPPGTEFLDAETGPPKSPPETTYARRDQKDPKPVAQIPAQNGLSEPDWKLPGSKGLDGGDRMNRTACPPPSYRTSLG